MRIALSRISGHYLMICALIGVLLFAGLSFSLFVVLAISQPYLLLIPIAAVAAFEVWKRPALGVVGIIALVAVPWGTGTEGQALAHITAVDLASAALVGIVAVRTLVVGDGGRLRSWVLLPLAGIIVVGCVATVMAYDPLQSLSGMVRYAQIFVIVPLATYLSIRDRTDLKLILGATLALAIFEGAIGVYQYLTGTGASFGAAGNFRAIGTFTAYNVTALSNIIALAIVISMAIFIGLRGRNRWWGALLVVALIFPLAFALSRGAWIAVAVGVVVILGISGWRRLGPSRLILLVLAGLLVVGIYYGSAGSSSDGGIAAHSPARSAADASKGIAANDSGVLTTRLASIFDATSAPDASVQGRYSLWKASWDIWAEHPITGVGVKNFPFFRDTYLSINAAMATTLNDSTGGPRKAALLSSHSLYFLVLVEQGILGILAYAAFFLSLLLGGLRYLGDTEESSVERVFGLAALGFVAGYVVANIYIDPGGSATMLGSIYFGGLVWLASGKKLEKGDRMRSHADKPLDIGLLVKAE